MDWSWPLFVSALIVVMYAAVVYACWLWERDRRRLTAQIVAEIKAQPSLILWIDEDGTVHTTFRSGEATAAYLEKCAAMVREQAAAVPADSERSEG